MARVATAADFQAFVGREPPAIWTGLVTEQDGEIVGAGIVVWDEDGRAWGSYSAHKRLPTITMHRAAKRMMAVLEAVGEPALYVFCSRSIEGAEKWLTHLGFKPQPELTTDPNHPVWACNLSTL